MKFNKGDIVKIKKNCTLEELDANHSNGCRRDTFEFLERSAYQDNTTYKIQKVVGEDKCVKIENYLVNTCCLELVRKNKNKKFKKDKCNIDKDLEKFIDLLIKGIEK